MNSAKQMEEQIKVWKSQGLSKAQIVINQAEYMMGWPYAWGAVGKDCTPSIREQLMNRGGISPGDAELIRKRCQVLNGSASACAGCKYYPNNERTWVDDCQGFVKMLHKTVGITLAGGGCTSMWKNDANWSEKGEIANMPKDKVCCVFKYISRTGKMDHIGEHIGGGEIIHCSGEVKRGKITEKGWTHYAIAKGMDGDVPVSKPTLRKGSTGPYVVECQEDLISLEYDLAPYGADGKYGNKTVAAVKQFQKDHELVADGVCGPRTWEALDAAVGPQPTPITLYTVTIQHLTIEQADELKKQYPDADVRAEGSELQ